MTEGNGEGDRCSEALEARTAALERIFGQSESVIYHPVPFFVGGGPAILEFRHYLKGANVYCTSDMTGNLGSGQQVAASGGRECEFVVVTKKESSLNPRRTDKELVQKGWVGVILTALAKYSCDTLLSSGDTLGPWDELQPMRYGILHDLTSDRLPFEFGGHRYGLMLCMLVTDAEFELRSMHGSAALVRALREAGAFPISDLQRSSAV